MAKQRINFTEQEINRSPVLQRIQRFVNYRSNLEDGNTVFPDGYIPQIEDSIDEKLRETGISVRDAMQRIGMAMHHTREVQQGHYHSLEQLAEEVIHELFGSLLVDVELDIQLVEPGEPAQQMDPGEPGDPPEMEEIAEEEIRNEIFKRRIANYLTQGAAINVHRIIHMPEYRERLNQISPDLVETYDDLLKLNEILSGSIPIEDQEQMWRMAPEGIAGSVKVEWVPEENEDEINQDNTDLEDNDINRESEEDDSESYVEHNARPIIHARGIDFPMLVHETVKGIYELIMAAGIPEDENISHQVIENSDTINQELVGQRIGPQIRIDMLDYINQHHSDIDVENLLELVLSRLIALPAIVFLRVINGMFLQNVETRETIDNIISNIVEEVREFELDQISTSDEDEFYTEENEDDVIDKPDDVEHDELFPSVNDSDDLSKKSKIELMQLMDVALDVEDWDRTREIGNYLNKFL